MAKFLTASGASAQIESVIMNAKEFAFPVSSHVSGLSGTLFQSVKAPIKKVPAHVIYREQNKMTPQPVAQTKQSGNLTLPGTRTCTEGATSMRTRWL